MIIDNQEYMFDVFYDILLSNFLSNNYPLNLSIFKNISYILQQFLTSTKFKY